MPKVVTAALAGGGVIVAAAVLLLTWPLVNEVETGRTPEYPDLTPRTYRASSDRVFDAALHVVNRLPRWTLLTYRPGSGEIRAAAKTRVFRFMDDVLIRVTAREDETVVTVRSASRVGRGDFGQNARNIRGFLEELDREMGGAPGHD